jgi:hypothetical protein
MILSSILAVVTTVVKIAGSIAAISGAIILLCALFIQRNVK